jgi:hypothetical protein
MTCFSYALGKTLFAKMTNISKSSVPNENVHWNKVVWEWLSLVAERIADDFYFNALMDSHIPDPSPDTLECKFSQLITNLKNNCNAFQKVPLEERSNTLQYLDMISNDDFSEKIFDIHDFADIVSFSPYRIQLSIDRFCSSTYYNYENTWSINLENETENDEENTNYIDLTEEDTQIVHPLDQEEDYSSMPELVSCDEDTDCETDCETDDEVDTIYQYNSSSICV